MLLHEAPGGVAVLDDPRGRIQRAVDLGLNVLASSDVLPRIPDGLPDECRLDARGLRDLGALLTRMGSALRVGPVDGDPYDQLASLAKRLWEAERQPTLVLRNLEAPVAVALFGRLRDEVWELPVRWLVVVSPAVGAVLDQPPSSAFFEVTIG